MPRAFATCVAILVAVSIAVAGCASTSTPSPSQSAAAAATPSPSATVATELESEPIDETPGPGSSGITQTDTEWGRIWDALPRSFPVYPGAEETTDIGAPATEQFVVPANVTTATTWMKNALDATGLRTTVSTPLEDGSRTLDSVGPNGCAVRTTIAPTGGVTLMTILYGAKCPYA
jgi:hypothetical protein